MKCSQIEKMISRYVDNDLGPEERRLFELHIQDCSGCKQELEKIRAVHQLFASAERFPAPYGFTTRVMANLEAKEPSWLWQLFTLRPFFLRAVEVAFALIIMIIGAFSGNLLVGGQSVGKADGSGDRAGILFARSLSGHASRLRGRSLCQTDGGRR